MVIEWRIQNLTKIVVRKFRESDVEDVVEIFDQVGLVRNVEDRNAQVKRLTKTAREPEWYDHYFVSEIDGKVVGRVILEAAYPPYSELANLYVHSDCRGVGSSLVEGCIEAALARSCPILSVMTDPVGNLPAHRLYSKFGFRPGILGDPSKKRGHMWLFRFSEQTCVSEFLRRHPFAAPSVSQHKVDFHGRLLYRMAWRDPQTGERIDLYIEGQPSQTLEGTMPRIAGFCYKEKDARLEASLAEQVEIITRGETSKFAVSIWNLGSRTLRITSNASVPEGTDLTPQSLPPIEIDPKNEKTIQFVLTWPSSCSLPEFTTFATVPVTFFFEIEGLRRPLFASAGFRRESDR